MGPSKRYSSWAISSKTERVSDLFLTRQRRNDVAIAAMTVENSKPTASEPDHYLFGGMRTFSCVFEEY